MSTFRPDEHRECDVDLGEHRVRLSSSRLGGQYVARVENLDPGGVIGRGRGESRESAEEAALAQAAERLQVKRRMDAMRHDIQRLRASLDSLARDLSGPADDGRDE